MKELLNKLICKIGLHNKHKFINTREVNWLLMSKEITQCKICKKIF